MLRILSWSSGLGCDKVLNPECNIFVPKQQPSLVSDMPLNNSVKRKRSPSFDAPTIAPLTTETMSSIYQGESERVQADAFGPIEAKIKQEPSSTDTVFHNMTPSSTEVTLSNDQSTQKSSETRLKQMRQTISTQLSLEILLKHKELRLIDQEIAKCQVALEQLRRCNEIPFPAMQNPSFLVSEGKGSVLKIRGEQYPAKSPAPWGVTDGPYSRHYAKWLLPDARFDGGELDAVQIQNIMDAAVPARSTRGSFVEVSKSLKSRSTIRSGNFKSLPAGYGQPKEKATGPMILKRKSDNTMVKLVCPDCGRHDFGSAQGFINHCRIGHGRSFASHDAAAEACGEPIEYNENGTIKGIEPAPTPTSGSMHPLIRSAKLLSDPSASIPASTMVTDPTAHRHKRTRASIAAPDFSPSVQTPHLSELIQRQGLGLNLQALVSDVKSTNEIPESDHEDDDTEVDSPLPQNNGRHPPVAGSKQPLKSTSGKGQTSLLSSRIHYNQDYPLESPITERSPRIHAGLARSSTDFMHPLLPSPTNESTQAPSLVDDDEEFDPQSPVSSDEIDEAEVDFDVHDDEHGERAVLRSGDLSSPTTCTPVAPTRTHTRRPSTFAKPAGAQGDGNSINFASPSPYPEGSDRKRRKVEEN